MNLEEWIAAFKNWSFISCGELHCDSAKIKTMINYSLFYLRQCESLDWSDCLVVLLLSATHFWKSGHARLIRRCFSLSQCFRAGIFSSLSRPLPAPFDSPHLLLSSGSFKMALSQANCALKQNACTAGYVYSNPSTQLRAQNKDFGAVSQTDFTRV